MTKSVEGVSEKIIACAKEEFLKKGYSDASLRTIAAKAGTTTGSIYSRFQDKEGLFSAIVEPAADHLVQRFLHIQETFHGLEEEQQPKEMKHYVSSGMVEMIDFEVFELLLDASYGTKFQDFVERLVEIETEYTYKYMDVIHYRTEDGEVITEDFIHIMTRALFESMFEVVRHKMTKETALRYMDMLEKYHCGGWNAILKWE